jgi:hypothetical protein
VTPERPSDVVVGDGDHTGGRRLTALNEDLLGARTLGRVGVKKIR